MSLATKPINRAAPSIMAMMRPRVMQARNTRFANGQKRLLNMQPTRRLMRVSEDENRAHTISQRLRQIKKIPVELLPLGFVLLVAIVAAVYSLGRKLVVDKTLRLWRQNRQDD